MGERIAGARAGDQQEVLEELEQRGGARHGRVSGSEEAVRDAHQREGGVGGRAGPRIEPPDIGGASTSGRRAAEDCTTFFAVGENTRGRGDARCVRNRLGIAQPRFDRTSGRVIEEDEVVRGGLGVVVTRAAARATLSPFVRAEL